LSRLNNLVKISQNIRHLRRLPKWLKLNQIKLGIKLFGKQFVLLF
jgi:hypothetical protein